jgi:hypothetical protein
MIPVGQEALLEIRTSDDTIRGTMYFGVRNAGGMPRIAARHEARRQSAREGSEGSA